MEIAKNTKKMLRIGKRGGPPVFTDKFKDDLTPLKLNKREKEALNLNYGSLWVPRLFLFAPGKSRLEDVGLFVFLGSEQETSIFIKTIDHRVYFQGRSVQTSWSMAHKSIPCVMCSCH